jgi:hypothetical protein
VPPGRSTRRQASKVAWSPSASIATSTPRPSVMRRISSTGSPFEKSTVSRAHPLRHGEALGHAVDRDDRRGAHQPRARRGAEPDRPLGEDRHHVADPDAAGFRAAEPGRHDVGAHQHLLVARASGTGARFATASGTRTYSAWEPSMVLPNFQPPSGFQPCFVPGPSWEQRPQKQALLVPLGVIAPAITRWPSEIALDGGAELLDHPDRLVADGETLLTGYSPFRM